MNKITYKKIQFVLAFITIFVFMASLYFQYFMGLEPCPLCMMQRVCVFILLFLLGINLGTLKKAHIICMMQVIVAVAGLFFSLRQVWLLSLPGDKVPVCMPGLDVLIHYFPWQAVAKALFWGSGDCAQKSWSMLGISMPGWAALYFLFMLVVSLILYIRTSKLVIS